MAACCVLSACSAESPVAPVVRTPTPLFTQPQPPPPGLHGGVATGGIGVKVLLPTSPPSVLDADSGRSSVVTGIPAAGTNAVFRAGKHPVIVSAPACEGGNCTSPSEVFAYVDGKAHSLGKALSAAPAADGEGVWLIRDDGHDNCRLQRVSLAGVQADAGQTASCGTSVRMEGAKGLLIRINDRTQASEDVLIDPVTGRTVQQFPKILAMIGNRLLIEELSGFTVLDLDTGNKTALNRPGTDGQPGAVVPSPDGFLAAVEFGDSSWHSTSTQTIDVWVLDVRAGHWLQTPSMPYSGELKRCALDWSDAGDLVVADNAVAAWHPGEPAWRLGKAAVPEGRGNTVAVVR